jgi:hypothetical protein
MKKGKITFSFHFFDKKKIIHRTKTNSSPFNPTPPKKPTLHAGKQTLFKQGKLSEKLYQITQKKKM